MRELQGGILELLERIYFSLDRLDILGKEEDTAQLEARPKTPGFQSDPQKAQQAIAKLKPLK